MIYNLYLNFIKENKFLYLIYLVTLIYIPINKVGLPHFYGKLLGIIKDNNLNQLKTTFILLIIIWLSIQLLHIVSNYINSILMPKFQSYVRNHMINEIIDRYQNDYQELKLGEIITKIIKSPDVLQEVFVMIKDFIFKNILIIVSSFIYLYRYNANLGLIYLVCMGVIFIISLLYVNDCKKYIKISETNFDNTHEEIEDTLSNLLSIYTSLKTKDEKKRLEKLNIQTYKSENKVEKCNNKYRLVYSVSFIIVFIILNFYTYILFSNKQIKLSELTSIFIINYSILNSLMIIYYDTNDFIDTKTKIEMLINFLNKLPKVSKFKTKKIDKNKDITIRIKKLNFSYNKNKKIFNNLNLDILSKQKIVILGNIGSGKSTLGKLLVRLQDYESGDIYINDINLKELSIDELRKVVTYIPQHPKLFNRTLYENITYGLNKITPEYIIQILKNMDLNDLIPDFERLMHESVGKGGSYLSGGQRQIVWLIRSLLKDNKIVILDEPTSSLDSVNKNKVIKLINELGKTKTIILITHDLELVKHCDRMIVLSYGKIIKDKNIKEKSFNNNNE